MCLTRDRPGGDEVFFFFVCLFFSFLSLGCVGKGEVCVVKVLNKEVGKISATPPYFIIESNDKDVPKPVAKHSNLPNLPKK